VSAFCCNSGLCAVNDGALKSIAPTITARPTPQEKRRFAALALQRHISESTLALIAIRVWLNAQSPEMLPNPSSSGPALDRITIGARQVDRNPQVSRIGLDEGRRRTGCAGGDCSRG